MRHRNKKIILLIIVSSLLSFSAANAKNFNIYNAANVNQPYFSVNGTSGNVGIGITNPSSLLQILNNGWISAQNSAGTGVVNMFKVNANDQIEVGAPLNIGSFEFTQDSGLVTFVDMPVSAAATIGTPEGYTFKVDGDNIFTAYSESNGAGGVQNKRVGIGTIAPAATLDLPTGAFRSLAGTVSGLGSAGNVLVMADNNGGLFATSTANFGGSGTSLWSGTLNGTIWNGDGGAGNVGIGITNPVAKLQIYTNVLGMQDVLNIKNGAGGNQINGENIILSGYYNHALISAFSNPNSGYGGTLQFQTYDTSNNLNTGIVLNAVGNVGIGAANPGAKLEIAQSDSNTTDWNRNEDLLIRNTNGTNNTYSLLGFRATGNVAAGIMAQYYDVANAYASLNFATRGASGWSGTAMTIRNGNVGIGNTNPAVKLELTQPTGSFPKMRFSAADITLPNYSSSASINDVSLTNTFGQIRNRMDGMGVQSGGLLIQGFTGSGVNNNFPLHLIGIQGGTSPTTAAVTIGGQKWDGGSNRAALSGNEIILDIENNYAAGAASPIVRVLGSGNVGIGTTAPVARLDLPTGAFRSLAGTVSGLGSAGSVIVMADNNGGLYSTSTASFFSSYSPGDLWAGTTGGKIWNANYGYNVGMGTTNPFRKLDINQPVDGTQLQVRNNSSDTLSQSAGIQFSLGDSGVITDQYAKGALFFKGDGSDWGRGDFLFALDNAADTGNASTSDAKMVIRKDGNVGIGVTNPGAKLVVSGNTMIGATWGRSNLGLSVAASYDNSAQTFPGDADRTLHLENTSQTVGAFTSLSMRVDNTGNGTWYNILHKKTGAGTGTAIHSIQSTQIMALTSGGNVGIGTTTPIAKLHVAGTQMVGDGVQTSLLNEATLQIQKNNGATTSIALWQYGVASSLIGHKASDPNLYITNNYSSPGLGGAAYSITLKSDGNVGIGATAPAAKLDLPTGAFRSLAGTVSGLGSAGNVLVMADNNGGLYATSTANFGGSGTSLWSGTLNGTIWNGDAGVGNVGIGTTSPLHKLDISGGNYNNQFRVISSDPAGSGITLQSTEAGGREFSIISTGTGDYPGAGTLTFWDNTNGLVASSARMVINSAGNVGIGTVSPAAALHVNYPTSGNAIFQVGTGDGSSNTDIKLGYNSYGWYWRYLGSGAGDNNELQLWSEGAGSTDQQAYGIKQSGIITFPKNVYFSSNVGIGTTVPTAQLNIESTGTSTLTLGTSNASNVAVSGILRFQRGTADYAWSGIVGISDFSDQNGLAFYTAPGGVAPAAEKMRLSKTGNLGIGTTNPDGKLDLPTGSFRSLAGTVSGLGSAGNVLVMADNNGGLFATSTANFGGTGTNFWGGTKNGTIWNGDAGAGNVGIGMTAPFAKLHVIGPGSTTSMANNLANFSSETPLATAGNLYGIFIDKVNYAGFMIGINKDTVTGSVPANTPFISNWSSTGMIAFGRGGNNNLPSTVDLLIGSTGNIGIGTTNPGVRFQVNGGDQTGPTLGSAVGGFALTGSNNLYGMYAGVSTNGDTWFQSQRNDTSTSVYRLLLNPSGGNVGIGTTAPTSKLQVPTGTISGLAATITGLGAGGQVLVMADNNGGLYATSTAGFGGSGAYLPLTGGGLTGDLNMGGNDISNINKLTVNTIDPLYQIQGVNYSTFAASIAGGVKEEYVGRAKINNQTADGEREYVIDFNNVSVGSDLWVWRKTVDFSEENVEVLLTPYGSFAQVYYKIEDNKLIFRSDRATTISYRLSGRRVDWRNWPTRAVNQTDKAGFVIE